MEQLQIVIIVGSLRNGSVNLASARAAIALLPDDVDAAIHPVAEIPLYNGDVEAQGAPDSVAQLHEAAARCDGLLFFTPEYNSSFPAVTKNVIDWLSREPKGWTGKAVSAVATSPGRRAGAGVLAHFEQSVSHQPVRLFDELLGIGSYRDKLDEAGELSDEDTRAELAAFLARFVDFARSTPEASSGEQT